MNEVNFKKYISIILPSILFGLLTFLINYRYLDLHYFYSRINFDQATIINFMSARFGHIFYSNDFVNNFINSISHTYNPADLYLQHLLFILFNYKIQYVYVFSLVISSFLYFCAGLFIFYEFKVPLYYAILVLIFGAQNFTFGLCSDSFGLMHFSGARMGNYVIFLIILSIYFVYKFWVNGSNILYLATIIVFILVLHPVSGIHVVVFSIPFVIISLRKNKTKNIRNLVYSGILIMLGLSFTAKSIFFNPDKLTLNIEIEKCPQCVNLAVKSIFPAFACATPIYAFNSNENSLLSVKVNIVPSFVFKFIEILYWLFFFSFTIFFFLFKFKSKSNVNIEFLFLLSLFIFFFFTNIILNFSIFSISIYYYIFFILLILYIQYLILNIYKHKRIIKFGQSFIVLGIFWVFFYCILFSSCVNIFLKFIDSPYYELNFLRGFKFSWILFLFGLGIIFNVAGKVNKSFLVIFLMLSNLYLVANYWKSSHSNLTEKEDDFIKLCEFSKNLKFKANKSQVIFNYYNLDLWKYGDLNTKFKILTNKNLFYSSDASIFVFVSKYQLLEAKRRLDISKDFDKSYKYALEKDEIEYLVTSTKVFPNSCYENIIFSNSNFTIFKL